jgi:hypothetical protein
VAPWDRVVSPHVFADCFQNNAGERWFRSEGLFVSISVHLRLSAANIVFVFFRSF